MTKTKAKKPKHVDVRVLTNAMLADERDQNYITLKLGLGSAGRAMLEGRNQEIGRELERRAALTLEALQREQARRGYVDRFQRVPVGTMVTCSAWWHQQHAGWPAQYGVITALEVYQENGVLITYPMVWWEGSATASTTHPDNAVVANTAWRQARG